MFNISPYIAKYVRGLHANEESFKVPYSHTQFGVVLMVDVVGFSTLTTLAQQKGDSGAEAIAMEIGAYMGECIQIIEFYGGDVVKFLGDAVLVCFQPISDERRNSGETVYGMNETEASERQKNRLVRRGIECGLQLLARLSHYRVYLTAEERSKHRTLNGSKKERKKQTIFDAMTPCKSYESSTNVEEEEASLKSVNIPKGLDESSHISIENLMPAFMRRRRKKNKTRRLSNASDLSASMMSEMTDTVDLELHMALSCGNVVNIILGDLDPDAEHPEPSSYPQVRSDVPNATNTKTVLDEFFLEYHGRLEYTIGGDVVDSLDEALTLAKAGEMSITPIVYDIIQRQAMNLTFERRRRFFVIKNITEDIALRKNNYTHTSPLRKGSTAINNNVQFLKTLPGLQTKASKMTIEPLIPRIRNTGQMNLPIESNKLYMKYINRSALYRMQNSVDGSLPAQFREVTIMFVSLGKTDVQKKEGLVNVQKAVMMTIKALVKYEGMLQQFAIDDKGATLLSVFGLPPLSHEREAVFAAKAALDIRDSFRQVGFQGFAISLSTGIIFTAVLPQGSPYRRDAGIAGDTIVVAVRMLKFPFSKENVVCDSATKKQIGGLCEFQDYGENFVKGKVKPVHIFGIQKFGPPERDNRISVLSVERCIDFIGYKFEIERASAFVDDWNEAPNHHTLVISGPSGVGKSFFCNRLHKTISLHGVLSCWSSSTEVEKGSKYYLLRTLILALFEIIDSDKIPVKPMTRTDINSLSTADSIHQGFNRHSRSVADSIVESENSSRSLSSASFPTTQEWFKRLTAYSSVSPSSFGSASNSAEMTNDMIELISRCLHNCGEERGYMPLFKLIFTTLNEVEENRYTRLLDGRAKDILLTGVITRMVLHVSKHIGLVFICDDIQWADTASIHMLQHIHTHCQRVMLLMSTRPIRDYNVTFLKDFEGTGTYEEIALNGLGETEIGEIILQNFDQGVNRISPEIVKVIQKRTGGNPLYVKNMAIILKDFDHVTVVEGELLPSSSSFDLEDLMGNFDYKRIIKMQFDRLESNYQEFLTVASCLDQYFTAHEVEAAIKENNFIFKNNTPEMIHIYIQNFDVYHFLQQIDNGNSLDNNVTLYSFTHITIPQSIYDMVSYETRIELHRSLAKYYESQLNKENFIQLLGKITRHYLKTDSTGKQLYYLEALADQNMQTYLLLEATSNLQKIVQILEQDPDLLEQFGHIRLSDIYRRLGICFTMRTKLREGELYLYKALEALGEPWPKHELKFLCKLWANRFKQYQHRKWRVLAKLSALSRREIVYRVVEIMTQLSNIYFYTGNGRDFSYACLVGLNACEKLDDVGPNYTLLLARNALLCWLNDEKDSSIYYIAKALRQIGADKSDSDTLTICSLLCFAAGKFSNARDLLYQSIDGSQTLGIVTDCQAFYRSVGLVVTMRIFEGTFNRSATDMALLKQMANIAHSNGDYEAEIWLSVYNIGNAIVIDRMADCSPYVALLEAHIKNAADYNRIAIHGTLVCYYARNHMYELARRHIQKLVNILPELTVTPNIFPIYGLIFATMGLYCLVEDGQIDLRTNDDSKDYEKLISGLSRLNHAFQQVKFWEFTQPCLYLARALPYVTTRRIVEGYMVLRHGVFEMQFIQEIRFLKAYYWANLGKFAFTPEDRIEWTERAVKDFEILGIPADTYCNSDPGNYYYRGFQADLCSNTNKQDQDTIVQVPDPIASTSKNIKTVPNDTV